MDIYEVQKTFSPSAFFSSHFYDFFRCKIIRGRDDPLTLGIRCTRRVTDWERHLSKALKNRPAPGSTPTSLPSGSFLHSRNNTCRGSAGAPSLNRWFHNIPPPPAWLLPLPRGSRPPASREADQGESRREPHGANWC